MARDTARRRCQHHAARAAGGGLPVLQRLNGPRFPRMIHLLIQHPTPYLRQLVRGELREQRALWRRDHARSHSADRETVPRHRSGVGAGDDGWIDRRLGSIRRAGQIPRCVQRRVGALSGSDRFPVVSIREHLRRPQRVLLPETIRGSARRSLAIATIAITCIRRSRSGTSSSSRLARTADPAGSTTRGRRFSARSAPTGITSRSTTK